MRNVFDQYSQPENRLTHALVSTLDQDRQLLASFLKTFGPPKGPRSKALRLIEQGLPGRPDLGDEEVSSRGLPDAVIYTDAGWALIIESKVNDAATASQLRRHARTVEKCGFDSISGLAITVRDPAVLPDGWRCIAWKDVYTWAFARRAESQWATLLVNFFNAAEARMVNDKYLTDGTITEFSGISFDPYTYLEAKRVLRLLSNKIRRNASFIAEMRLDADSRRASITKQERLWDFISFVPPDHGEASFTKFPHCTIAIGPLVAEAMITFPSGMSPTLRRRLHGTSFDGFAERLTQASHALVKALQGITAYRPMARVMQRRYPTQSSVPLMDGRMEFDLRTVVGESNIEPRVKAQQQWARAAYEVLANKRSNIQFQIGVEIYYPQRDELAHKDADRYFLRALRAVRKFASPVVD